jgi:hypothetical protein
MSKDTVVTELVDQFQRLSCDEAVPSLREDEWPLIREKVREAKSRFGLTFRDLCYVIGLSYSPSLNQYLAPNSEKVPSTKAGTLGYELFLKCKQFVSHEFVPTRTPKAAASESHTGQSLTVSELKRNWIDEIMQRVPIRSVIISDVDSRLKKCCVLAIPSAKQSVSSADVEAVLKEIEPSWSFQVTMDTEPEEE